MKYQLGDRVIIRNWGPNRLFKGSGVVMESNPKLMYPYKVRLDNAPLGILCFEQELEPEVFVGLVLRVVIWDVFPRATETYGILCSDGSFCQLDFMRGLQVSSLPPPVFAKKIKEMLYFPVAV